MVDYCTEAEIEAFMIESFDANSTPTTTDISTLITRASRMVDAVQGESDDYFGSSPDNNITQATIETCSMLIDNFRESDPQKRHSMNSIRSNIQAWLNKSTAPWAYTTVTSRNQNNDYLGPARPERNT